MGTWLTKYNVENNVKQDFVDKVDFLDLRLVTSWCSGSFVDFLWSTFLWTIVLIQNVHILCQIVCKLGLQVHIFSHVWIETKETTAVNYHHIMQRDRRDWLYQLHLLLRHHSRNTGLADSVLPPFPDIFCHSCGVWLGARIYPDTESSLLMSKKW